MSKAGHSGSARLITVGVSWRSKRLIAGFTPRKSPNLQTTIRFYVGLETAQASERFGEIVRAHLAPRSLEGVSGW